MIYSVWDSRFSLDNAGKGLQATDAIWQDMPAFDGYLGHELLVDADDAGHLLVVSQWVSREHADAVLREYSGQPNAQAADRLAAQPRRRFVAVRYVPERP